MALTDKLTAIANAIRTKTGGSGALTLTQMPTAISNIVVNTGWTPTACNIMPSQYVTVSKYGAAVDLSAYTSAAFIFVDGVGGDVVFYDGASYTFFVQGYHGEGSHQATISNDVFDVASELWEYRDNHNPLYIIT